MTQLQVEQAPFPCLANRLFIRLAWADQTIILHSSRLEVLEWCPHFSLPIQQCFVCSSSWSLSSFEPKVKWILDLFWYFRNHSEGAHWYTLHQRLSSTFGLGDSFLAVFKLRLLWWGCQAIQDTMSLPLHRKTVSLVGAAPFHEGLVNTPAPLEHFQQL